MEIKLHRKELLQTQGYLVIKLLVIISLLASCSGYKIITKKESYNIINSELSYLTKNLKNNYYLEMKFNNKIDDLLELFLFKKENYEFHFLNTTYNVQKNVAKTLFNKIQIKDYLKQSLKGDDKIIKKNIINKPLKKAINLEYEVMLSKVFFTKNKEFAWVKYDINIHSNTFNSGISIYKKNQNKWTLYRRISLGV